jgi:hypothetical protein
MPEIEVSAEDVARLGDSLAEVSAFLRALDHATAVEPWALGPGSAAGAVQDVLGNWERYRLLLADRLDELAGAAQGAGSAYLQVETEVAAALGGR